MNRRLNPYRPPRQTVETDREREKPAPRRPQTPENQFLLKGCIFLGMALAVLLGFCVGFGMFFRVLVLR